MATGAHRIVIGRCARQPKVIPALKHLHEPLESQGGEAASVEQSVNIALTMGSIAVAHCKKDKTGLLAGRKEAKKEREASYQLIRAWDHALATSLGKGLAAFLPSGLPSKRLRQGEARYLVDSEPWGSYETPPGVPWKKVCIYDAASGATRLEIPHDYTDNKAPALTISADECSINLSAYQYLAHRLGARIVLMRDQAHRCWRDYKLAVTGAGLWPTVLELMHCMNCRHGPWSSQAWFRQTVESVQLHSKVASSGCPMFQALVGRIAFDFGLGSTCETATAEEVRAAWKQTLQNLSLGKKGSRVNLTRWFEFLSGYEEFQASYHCHLYEYRLVLYYTHTLRSLPDFPVWETHSVPMEWKDLCKPTAQSDQATKSEGKAAEQRNKAVNSVHMAAMILGQGGQFRRGRVLLCVGRMVRKAFASELQGATKADQTLAFHISHANHGHSLVFRRIFKVMSSTQSLEFMLFDFGDTEQDFYNKQFAPDLGAASSSSGPGLFLKRLAIHEKHIDEVGFAELVWSLVCATVRHRGMTISQFVDLPLGQMALLLGSQQAIAKCLAKQKLNWQVLEAAERKQFTDGGVALLLKVVCFVEEQIVRELLIQLAQQDFKFVSPVAMNTLRCIYGGFCHSVVVEKGSQKLQDIGREQKDTQMSRLRRWYWLHQSQMLKEFERSEVDPATAVLGSGVPRRLPKSLFHALGSECTIKDEELKDITQPGRIDWATCSAQGIQIQPAAWRLLTTAF